MRKVTATLLVLLFAGVGNAFAQKTDYIFAPQIQENFKAPYSVGTFENGSYGGVHSGARGVTGPYDLDGDGDQEVLLTDYSGGGRVHVLENKGVDTWELVYSTPWQDSTASGNARYAVGADLDDDGDGEIVFVSGNGFSADNDLALGVHIYEYTGEDDDYGDAPVKVLEPESKVQGTTQPSIITEKFAVQDVDGDGQQEILLPANSSSDFDIFYIYEFTGDELSDDFSSFSREFELNARSNSARFGSGSPYAINPADLDGDGTLELSLHTWNSFNFFNVDVDGEDSYTLPAENDENSNLQAAPNDHVSLFGGVVTDINQDGDDEVFYPRYQSFGNGMVSLLNYSAGDDVLEVTTDNLIFDILSGLSSLGLTAGDLDGDGKMELIGSGPAYSAATRNDGEKPTYVQITEFMGGDPEDPANYSEVQSIDITQKFDTLGRHFDRVIQDSAGTTVREFYRETNDRNLSFIPFAGQGSDFVTKPAYLGDVDGDNANEVALSFQGVDDSTYVYREAYQDSSMSYYPVEIVERRAIENRAFLRIISSDGTDVDVVDERVVLPSDYTLSQNYPNPFSGNTSFTFELPLKKTVSVRVYNEAGRLVKTLVDEERRAAGTPQEVTWDGTNEAGQAVASGVYFYTLEHGTFRTTRKMVLVK